jgi:prophage maintenance system killer protein
MPRAAGFLEILDRRLSLDRAGAIVFAELNDHEFLATSDELVEMTFAVAEGKIEAEALAIWFRQRLRTAD